MNKLTDQTDTRGYRDYFRVTVTARCTKMEQAQVWLADVVVLDLVDDEAPEPPALYSTRLHDFPTRNAALAEGTRAGMAWVDRFLE